MSAPSARLDWARDGAVWPHRDHSRFVRAGGLRWHVQRFEGGARARVLLLHGTASASHSWRALAPELARDHDVVAPDLPGHGFTDRPPDAAMSLPGMAAAVLELIRAMAIAPDLVVGHSAGAAIAVQVALASSRQPAGVVGINGAWSPLRGLPGRVMPAAAKLLAGPARAWSVPLIARLAGDGGRIDRLLLGTGSHIDDEGRRLYAMLLANRAHVEGTLAMMARWDLRPLWDALPALRADLLLLVGSHDRTVAPAQSFELARSVPTADLRVLTGLGHLAHEEDAPRLAAEIRAFAARLAAAPPP